MGPRLFNAIVRALRSHDRLRQLPSVTKHILLTAFSLSELPLFWALLFGSSVSARRLIEAAIIQTGGLKQRRRYHGLTSFLGAAVASSIVMRWHQRRVRKSAAIKEIESVIDEKLDSHDRSRTIDTTLFTVTAAVDYLFRREVLNRSRLAITESSYDIMSFVASCAIVMYAWFYKPERLPKSYNTWITRYADLDTHLLEMLRMAQNHTFAYGVDNGISEMMEPMCKKIGVPREYGDPSVSIPLPCVLIHENMATNCEMHAVLRFWKSFKGAMLIYLPLNLILRLRSTKSASSIMQRLLLVLRSSARSSSFLGLFVTLTWYGVCLTRSRLGPWFFPKAKPITWDNTLGPALGCLLCGWSM